MTTAKKSTSKPAPQARPRLSFVVVYGPPASGKTLNGEALRKHYKCLAVMDERVCQNQMPWLVIPGRVLLLALSERVRDPYDRRRWLKTRTVSIEKAAHALGSKWVQPRDFAGVVWPDFAHAGSLFS